ncbi:GNAT family N-acetyltransferase [Aeoliella sp. SH292]|uniref:GNAT family N-acetyltransferase n=1 Tax=Aeoliella sp. SH292 TaxID=3454464 RepID=UPI003F9C122E
MYLLRCARKPLAMSSIRLLDDHPELAVAADFGQARVVFIESPGELFDACYELFERVFEPEVLDSKQTYLDRFEQQAKRASQSSPCLVAALVEAEGKVLVAGISSAHVLALPSAYSASIVAIANVAISKACRGKGIGALLLHATRERAKQLCAEQQRVLDCIVLESEVRSLRFWRKMGFRWPKGMFYYQPPLKWNHDGSPVHKEVRETFLIARTEVPAATHIETTKLLDIVGTLYENWSLRDIRGALSPEAVSLAEDYLRTRVSAPVVASLMTEQVELVDPLQSQESS